MQLQSSTDQLKNTNYNKWDHAEPQRKCSKGSLLWI